ncbi:MAG: hypothetical protein ACE5IJ_06395 [Thermoplasmata archaeon]
MAFELWLVFIVGSLVSALGVLLWVFLRRPFLASVPMKPEVATAALAHRLRIKGYQVAEEPRKLLVRINDWTRLAIRWRGDEETVFRYSVDATPRGWGAVLVLAIIVYTAVLAIGLAAYIHWKAVRAAHRVQESLARDPLAPPHPDDVGALLLDGLSEARRLAVETLEYEREAWENAIVLVVLGAFLLGAFLFVGAFLWGHDLVTTLGLPATSGLLVGVAVAIGLLGYLLLRASYRPRLQELRSWDTTFREAFERELAGEAPPEGESSAVELLAEAAIRAPLWSRERRLRKLHHDPAATWIAFALAGSAAYLFAFTAFFVDPFWRLLTGSIGAVLTVGAAAFWRRWRRGLWEEERRTRASWEAVRRRLEDGIEDIVGR